MFVYHSGGVSGVVGLASVRSEPRDDPKNPKSAVVNLEYRGPHQRLIIETCRRLGRLSTMAAPEKFVTWIRQRYPEVKF